MSQKYDEISIDKLLKKLEFLAESLLTKKNKFTILSDDDLPLHPPKMHTRSISWLAEEVIRQNIEKFKDDLNIESIIEPESDILPYDCILKFKDFQNPIYINFKVSDSNRSDTQSNDISEITKLIDFFSTIDTPILFEMIFKIRFEGFNVYIDAKKPIVFFLPWLSHWIINKSQHKVQAAYKHSQNKISWHQFLVNLLNESIKPVNKVVIKNQTLQNLKIYSRLNPFPSEIQNFISKI